MIKTFTTLLLVAGMLFAQNGLSGTHWKLLELNHSKENIGNYSLRFTSDTTASASLQINGCLYSCTGNSSLIKFKLTRITLVVLSGREKEFLTTMDSVTRYSTGNVRLLLMNASDTLLIYELQLQTTRLSSSLKNVPSIKVDPVQNGFAVTLADAGPGVIRLITANGTRVLSRNLNDRRTIIPTHGLAAGVYVVEVVGGGERFNKMVFVGRAD